MCVRFNIAIPAYVSLKLVSKYIPSIPRGLLIDSNNKFSLKNILDICNKFNCFSVGLDSQIVDYEIIQSLKKNKLKVNIFTINDIEYAKNIFKLKKIPFRQITFTKKNEGELGEIFTFFVLETILLSRLMNINPFDQPAVEQVKIETKKFLR